MTTRRLPRWEATESCSRWRRGRHGSPWPPTRRAPRRPSRSAPRGSPGSRRRRRRWHCTPEPPGRFSITPLDSAGDALENRTVTWAVTDPGVATVSDNGLVTAVANGQTAISATVEDSVTHIGVTVSDATTNLAVASVEVIQIAQDTLNSIPLLAGKPTLVRVWVTGNPSTQASRPVAFELFRHDVLDTTMIGMTAPTLPPGRTDELATPRSTSCCLPPSISATCRSGRSSIRTVNWQRRMNSTTAGRATTGWCSALRCSCRPSWRPSSRWPCRRDWDRSPWVRRTWRGAVRHGVQANAAGGLHLARDSRTALGTGATRPVHPGQALMEAVGLDILRVQTAEELAHCPTMAWCRN